MGGQGVGGEREWKERGKGVENEARRKIMNFPDLKSPLLGCTEEERGNFGTIFCTETVTGTDPTTLF